eukprot:557402-Alexandrium_andersonii.AAC.1
MHHNFNRAESDRTRVDSSASTAMQKCTRKELRRGAGSNSSTPHAALVNQMPRNMRETCGDGDESDAINKQN